jgi:hypothetical protein
MRASRVITLWMLIFSTWPSRDILFLTALSGKRVLASLLCRLVCGFILLGWIAGASLLWRTLGARAGIVAPTKFRCTFTCAAAPTNSCWGITSAGTPGNLLVFSHRPRVAFLSRFLAFTMPSSPASALCCVYWRRSRQRQCPAYISYFIGSL